MMKQTNFGIVLYCIMIIPPITRYLESMMFVHMLIQLPLLILSGWLMGYKIIEKCSGFFEKWNTNGIPGIIMVLLITTYWMLPRTLDEAISLWQVELFKFFSLPFLVGLPLRDSWKKLQMVGKSFIYLNYLPMFGIMAWLYLDSPIQICNNYLKIEQKMVGFGLLIITISMVLYLLHLVFTDHSKR